MAQGRRPGGGRASTAGVRNGIEYHEDTAYVNLMVELVSDDVVTPDEIRSTWSIDGQRGRRVSPKSWGNLLAKKKKDGHVIRIAKHPRNGNVEAYKRLQSAVLSRFAP